MTAPPAAAGDPADARVAFPFEALHEAPLVVDAVYRGGTAGNRGDDPIQRLTGTGNAGGFRLRNNSARTSKAYGVLYSSGADPDWPDILDEATGTFTYHGDQKTPGKELHNTARGGNRFLRDWWALAGHGPAERGRIPPLFLFVKAGRGTDVIFRGLLVPGSPIVPPDEQLVALWRSRQGLRYQNYRATFTVLDAGRIERQWLTDLMAGEATSLAAPVAWLHWASTGNHRALQAQRPLEYRSRTEQVPTAPADIAMITAVRQHFAGDETAFEPCAATLFRMLSPAATISGITRGVVDGGRDAFGTYSIGPADDPIKLDWSLEAKCYSLQTGVTTRHTARLISRLRHRQFGVLVTTSFVDRQAYQELREDRHPVIVIAAADIVRLLRARGFATAADVSAWLAQEFALSGR